MASSNDTPHGSRPPEETPDTPPEGAAGDGRREVDDAEIVSENGPDTAASGHGTERTDEAEQPDSPAEAQAESASAEDRPAEDTGPADTAPGDAGRDGATDPAPPAAAPPANPPPARGGAMPLVLGGVIAAALGAGALWWLEGEGIVTLSGTDLTPLEAQLATQADRIAAMESDLAPLREGLAGLDGGVTELANRLADLAAAQEETAQAGDLSGLADRVAEFDTRLSGLEELPMGADPEAMAILRGYRDEVAGLRSELQATTERAEALIEAAESAEARALAAEGTLEGIAAEAASAEATARARNALRQVEASFLHGGSFQAALDDLEGVGITAPDTLRGMAEEGVPTLADLREGFPEGAREALQIALRDVEDKPLADRMTAFLQLQFGMRSLTPRDGDDADAVLSRVEAALGEGEVGTALAELATLPAAVRAPLVDWAAMAETRQAAEAALADLTASVESL